MMNFMVEAKVYDSAYKSALANMLDNLFKVGLYSDNRDYVRLAKNILKQKSIFLVVNSKYAPTLFKVYVGSEKEYRVLKSKKANLLQNMDKIDKIQFPFLIIKATTNQEYLACTINSCFAYGKDIDKVLKKIQNY